MKRTYVFSLSKGSTFSFSLPQPSITSGAAGLYEIVTWMIPVIWFIYILGLFPSFLWFGTLADVAVLLWTYSFVVVVLFAQIARRFLAKGALLPPVPYDMPLLFFTSFIAIVLAYSVLINRESGALWGGGSLKAYSGLSLIAFWFLYYLVNVINKQRKSLLVVFDLLGISFLIAVVGNLLLGQPYAFGIAEVGILFIPAWLWLFFKRGGMRRYMYLVLLGIALYTFKFVTSPNYMLVILASLVIFLALIVTSSKVKLNHVTSKFVEDADKLFSSKLSIIRFIDRNSTALFALVSIVFSVMAVIWLFNSDTNVINSVKTSFEGFALGDFREFLIGRRLSALDASAVVQFVYSYGMLSFAILGGVIGLMMYHLAQRFNEKFSVTDGALIAVMLSVILYLIISPASAVLVTTVWIILGIVGAARLIEDKDTDETMKVLTFSGVKDYKMRQWLQIGQLVAVFVLLVIVIYFLTLIPQIGVLIR